MVKQYKEYDTKLKRLRLEKGWTQTQLSIQSGVPVQTIRHYEQEECNMLKARMTTVFRLARALSCDLTDLVDLPQEGQK